VALFFYLYKKLKVMQLKIKQSILRGGKRYNEGDKIELPDNVAQNWIAKGFASKVSKKQNKEKFETKELKVEYIEIKDDATNKD
jgi:hypothetical protein